MNSPTNNIPEFSQISHKHSKFYEGEASFFDFMVLSVSKMLDIEICTISLFDDHESVIVASSDNTVEKFNPTAIPKNMDLTDRHSLLKNAMNPLEKFEPKFFDSFPIINPKGIALGSLNLFDQKERIFTNSENEIIDLAIQQICKWISAQEHDKQLKKYKHLFEISDDMVGIISFTGKFLKLNPAFSEILGWKNEELLGRDFFHYLYEEDLEKTNGAMKTLREGKSIRKFINRFHTKHDGLKWIRSEEHTS